jgi:hypothetical protein
MGLEGGPRVLAIEIAILTASSTQKMKDIVFDVHFLFESKR